MTCSAYDKQRSKLGLLQIRTMIHFAQMYQLSILPQSHFFQANSLRVVMQTCSLLIDFFQNSFIKSLLHFTTQPIFLSSFVAMADERKLRLTFNALDLNGDGELDAAELTKVRIFPQHLHIETSVSFQFYLTHYMNQKSFGF
jgi:hypothetical protein